MHSHLTNTIHKEVAIDRSHLLRTIKAQLSGDVDLLIVEGVEGSGKTVMLQQCAKKIEESCVALFLSGASRWAYHPSQVASSIVQAIGRIATDVRLSEWDEEVDEQQMARAYAVLQRHASRSISGVYFILDGVDSIPPSDPTLRQQILSYLPIGVPHIKCILATREPKDVLDLLDHSPISKTLTVTGFPERDVREFLAPLKLDGAQVAQAMDLTDGIPGRVAQLRRVLLATDDVSGVLSAPERTMPELYRMEWDGADVGEGDARLAIAVLAHEQKAYSTEELAAIADTAMDRLEATLGGITFLKKDENGSWSFGDEAMRRFAVDATAELRVEVRNLVIANYSRDPDGSAALTELPGFLESSQRYEELLDFLTPDRFAQMYQTIPSVSLVKSHAEKGMLAADKLAKHADVVRFSLQRSALEAMSLSHSRVTEVRARVAVGDDDGAIAVGEGVPHPEVKLRLLAAIVRTMHDYGRGDESRVLDHLRHLVVIVDLEVLGEHVTEIAVDLFPSAPDLAMALVQRRVESSGDENALDTAMVRLTLEALVSGQKDFLPGNEPRLAEYGTDVRTKRLAIVAGVVLGTLSGEEVIAESTKMPGAGDQLYILQHWMRANWRRSDAVRVSQYGLALGLRTTGYSLNASTMLDLALCLPHSEDSEGVSALMELLDGQRAVMESVGPVEDAFRVRILCAQSIWPKDPRSGYERMVEIFDDIADLGDVGTQIALWGRLHATMKRLPQGSRVDSALEQLVGEALWDGVGRLLADSAFHVRAIASVLKAIAIAAPEDALSLVERLNTRRRRDQAYAILVDEAVRAPLSRVPWTQVEEALDRIWNPRAREAALTEACEFISRVSLGEGPPEGALALLRRVIQVPDPGDRLVICVRLMANIHTAGQSWGPVVKELRESVQGAWKHLPDSPGKVERGYEAIAELAKGDPNLANLLIAEVNGLTERLAIIDSESVLAATVSIHLAIRALAGAAAHHQDREGDVERLTDAVERLPERDERVRLFDDAASRLALNGRMDLAGAIVREHIQPILDRERSVGNSARADSLEVSAAPSQYLVSPVQALEEFRRLPHHARGMALDRALVVLLRRVPIGEPFREIPGHGNPISYEVACSAVALIRLMDEDNSIYGGIVRLVDCIRASSDTIKRAQVPPIASQLYDIVERKLPDPNNITHDGYVILARAAIAQMRGRAANWDLGEALAEACKIPSVSDRVFVLSEIARFGENAALRNEVIDRALTFARQIPLLSERVERVLGIARTVQEWSGTAARAILEEAMEMLSAGKADTVAELRRAVVNDAYRIDPGFAASLASTSDDDPARRGMQRDLVVNRLRDHLVGRGKHEDVSPSAENADMSVAAWMALGELNAGRTSASAPAKALDALRVAAFQPVSSAYPIFAWFIENAARYQRSGKAVQAYVVPLWEACMNGAELALLAGKNHRFATVLPGARSSLEPQTDHGAALIPAGGRRQAIEMMEEWVAEIGAARVLLIDPFFKPADMRIIAMLKDANPAISCQVLTGVSGLRSSEGAPGEAYRSEWERTREDDPPPMSIVFIATRRSHKCPVHDRWLLTETTGLQLGTSTNGLGSRISTVRRVERVEVERVREGVDGFLTGIVDVFDGERLSYTSIKL